MNTKKSIYALLSGLLLTAVLASSPLFADTVKAGSHMMEESRYTILNVDSDRAS